MKDRKEIEPYMAYKPTQVYNVLKNLSKKDKDINYQQRHMKIQEILKIKSIIILQRTIIISLPHLMMLKKVVHLQQLQPH